MAAHGRVLQDDGTPAPGVHVTLCANDGASGPEVYEPGTCVEGATDDLGAYALEVGNVAPEGSDCVLDVADPWGDGLVQRLLRPPEGSDDPMHVEVGDVHLSSPGSHDFLAEVRIVREDATQVMCTPHALHRCVLYESEDGHVRVWPPTDLAPTAEPCEGRAALFPIGGPDARRAGVFVRSDAVPTDQRHPLNGLLLQCTEGNTGLSY